LSLFEDGITGFFSRIREVKTGEKQPCLKVGSFEAVTEAVRSEQITNGQDVRIDSPTFSYVIQNLVKIRHSL
jgi:hypothetical protein